MTERHSDLTVTLMAKVQMPPMLGPCTCSCAPNTMLISFLFPLLFTLILSILVSIISYKYLTPGPTGNQSRNHFHHHIGVRSTTLLPPPSCVLPLAVKRLTTANPPPSSSLLSYSLPFSNSWHGLTVGATFVKVQDLDGAICTSCYWVSSACTTRWSFQRTLVNEVLTNG